MALTPSSSSSGSSTSPLTTKGDLFGFSTVSARVPVGTNTKVLTADSTQGVGVGYSYPPGLQLDYGEITAAVTITATADGNSGGTLVVSGAGVAYDGSTSVIVVFQCPEAIITPATAAHSVYFNLYDGTNDLGRIAQLRGPVVAVVCGGPVYVCSPPFTPSAASHTYMIRGWKDAAGDTASAQCGAGGASTLAKAYVRVVRA